ncbi:PH and SEC7 domain-containing protein 4-like isoform X2 [Ambystoma mexicanum]|uniref:PH and SEC7 domain-containing protein 4-like isoform X2 n=1 Tax=Ambystoma mexicanum TaxID=8296 RepID=UPI0037E8AF11
MEDTGAPDEDCHATMHTNQLIIPGSASHSGNSHLDGSLGTEVSVSLPSLALPFNPESSKCRGHQSTGTPLLGELDSDDQYSKGSSAVVLGPGFTDVLTTSKSEKLGSEPFRLKGAEQGLAVTGPLTASNDVRKGQQLTAQEMFLASIRQAQLCVLDLQDELDKQPHVTEELESLSLHPQQTTLPSTLEDATSLVSSEGEDGHFTPDSSDEDLEDMLWSPKDEEEEFSDIEEECHFYNNPLFNGSLGPSVIISAPGERRDLEVEEKSSSDDGTYEQAPEVTLQPANEGHITWGDCTEQDSVNTLDRSFELRAKAISSHPFPLSGMTNEGLYSNSALGSASQDGERNLQNTLNPSTEDAQGASLAEHDPQENEVSSSSADRHTSSSGAVTAEHDEALHEGLLISDSSFSMIAALLLDDDNADSTPPVNTSQPLWSAYENHPLALTKDSLGSTTAIATSALVVYSPPLSPDLISWEEPVQQPVTFCEGQPASPIHLLDWSLGKHSCDYSSSEEEEEEEQVDGYGGDERPGTSNIEDIKGTERGPGDVKNQEQSPENSPTSSHPGGTEFSRMVAQEYLAFFDFAEKTLDQALRSLLKVLVLTGETQERERVLEQFSRRFYLCNPEPFSSADAVHSLTCAVMLLNTDLHGKNIGRCMTCPEFILNLDGMNDGTNFPKDQLKELYHSIRNEKLEWAVDEEEVRNALAPKLEPTYSFNRKKSNPFQDLQLPDSRAETYKQGILSRKMHADIDGKRTPWGKRSWKDFYTVLKGSMLCLVKEEYRPDYQLSEEVIGIHHALAERASKYNKRPNVFRLQTADWRIYLFQAENDTEMNSWVSRINLVAAMFSSPPFPAAIGSQKRFVRPILPTAQSKHSLEDQRQSHELWMDTFTDDLADHQKSVPDKKSKARDWEEYRMRAEYLLYEKTRYETYVKLLDVKLRSSCTDLDQWEAHLNESSDTVDDSSPLKKSHSSPSLNQEQAPTVKVKRNISERRTYRRIIPKRNKNVA